MHGPILLSWASSATRQLITGRLTDHAYYVFGGPWEKREPDWAWQPAVGRLSSGS
jgi:hypothetical protein